MSAPSKALTGRRNPRGSCRLHYCRTGSPDVCCRCRRSLPHRCSRPELGLGSACSWPAALSCLPASRAAPQRGRPGRGRAQQATQPQRRGEATDAVQHELSRSLLTTKPSRRVVSPSDPFVNGGDGTGHWTSAGRHSRRSRRSGPVSARAFRLRAARAKCPRQSTRRGQRAATSRRG